jgi:phosphate starvation-inducible PhoH-like protein
LKGTLLEKLLPYYAPILSNLTDLLDQKFNGKGKIELEKLLKEETIVLQPIELMRGFTYKNCAVLVTEAQNMTVSQAVMAITRIGQGCKMIFEGDTDQKDIYVEDGLSFLISKLEDAGLCAIVRLDHDDIQRHPLIGKILTQLRK